MAEKRTLDRIRKRYAIRFGSDTPTRLAFTEDISTTGIFIKTTNVANPNTILIVELELSADVRVTLEGRVMWAKKMPPQMIHLVKKSGMGVKILRFISGENDYMKLFESQADSV